MQENRQANVPMHSSFTYQGKISALFKIFFLNLFLGIITLGIYHFWGKTRMRRYLANHFSLANDPFEYTGTGSELFFGMVKAFVFLIVISLPFFWAVYKLDTLDKTAPETSQVHFIQKVSFTKVSSPLPPSEKAKDMSQEKPLTDEEILAYIKENQTFFYAIFIILIYLVFYNLFLPFIAVFTSLKYRSSRIQWRGINGFLTGSTLRYCFYGFFQTLLKVVSFGFWIPFADLMIYRYKVQRLYFGDKLATFKAQYSNLFITHLATLFISLLLVVPFAVAYAGAFAPQFTGLDNPDNLSLEKTEMLIFYGVFLFWIFVIASLFIFVRYWYKAALMRAKYNGLSLGNLNFQCKVTGWQYARLKLGNFIIFMFTFGLGLPIIIQRKMRFISKHITVEGDISQFIVNQNPMVKSKTGEGISSLFDIGIELI